MGARHRLFSEDLHRILAGQSISRVTSEGRCHVTKFYLSRNGNNVFREIVDETVPVNDATWEDM